MLGFASPAPVEQYGSQIEEAYTRLRQEIIAGNLAPAEKLRIDVLRKRYDLGASGLREALSRLSAEGLVDSEPQRGFRVAPISRGELRDITATRQVIEVDALRQAIRHGNLEWEAAVVTARYRLERFEDSMASDTPAVLMGFEDANRQFHMALLSACPLRWLLRFTEQLYDQSLRYRHRTLLQRPIPRSGLSQDHLTLVDATLKRDAEQACKILSAHIGKIAQTAEITIFGPSP